MEDVKIWLSVLWLVNTVGGLSSIVFEFYEPGVLNQISSGVKSGVPLSQGFLLALVVLFAVSLIMAFLSVRLHERLNRGLNIIVGLVYFVISLILLVPKLEDQSVLAIGSVVGTVFAALIVWYAYKWPKS